MIGKGGMGVVYKARDLELEETVALKVMRGDLTGSPDVVRRFRSEIKLARKVTHPNVCRIHDYSHQGHLTYIVMEFVPGTDLKRAMRQRGGFEPLEALDLILQVAQGLHAVHRQGVVHRDLKTPNIMCTPDGAVKLMDFGIAKSFTGEAATGATATGFVVGTPEYMSPEQARAEAVDARTDIYAAGIVLFELLTGELPFRGDTPIATLLKQMQNPPPLEGPGAARIPTAVVPVLRRALAKNPADRYATVLEMAADLERAQAQMAPLPPSVVAPPGRSMASPAAAALPAPTPEAATPILTVAPTAVPTAVPAPPAVAAPPKAGRLASRPALVPAAAPASAAGSPSPSVQPGGFRSAPARDPIKTRPRARGATPGVAWAGIAAVVVAVVSGVWLIAGRSANGPEPATEALQPSAPPEAVAATLAPLPPSLIDTSPSLPSPASPAADARSRRPSVLPTSPLASVPLTPMRSAPSLSPAEISAGPLPTLVFKPIPSPSAPDERAAPRGASLTTAPPAIAVPEPAPEATASPPANGALMIGVKPYARVIIDGQTLGTTPLGALTLAAGSHAIVLLHPDYQPLRRKITIRAGETARLTVDLALDGIPK